MMKRVNLAILLLGVLLTLPLFGISNGKNELKFFKANNPDFQYTGRIDFSNPAQPRLWMPGIYIQARFRGTSCSIVVNDEMLYGTSHNYIEVVIDNGKPERIATHGQNDTMLVASHLKAGDHSILICKDTESGIGYLDFLGMQCAELLTPFPKPTHKIEFIGNSITCGFGNDTSVYPCGKGQWYDQENAYESYAPVTARVLHAQWYLSSVSGIGMIHSCCNMKILMPEVFDKIDMRDNKIPWDFKRYRPDLVTICLGQNDGVQDSVAFCSAYVNFIKILRSYYPNATILCLSSPMADSVLNPVLHRYLDGIVNALHNSGDKNVYRYFFSKRYDHGCIDHPDIAEDYEMAKELVPYIRHLMHW
jgi:Carbohydrate esterase 2 N-terminal/GDSL-like Lipase/Acylhydrolase family